MDEQLTNFYPKDWPHSRILEAIWQWKTSIHQLEEVLPNELANKNLGKLADRGPQKTRH